MLQNASSNLIYLKSFWGQSPSAPIWTWLSRSRICPTLISFRRSRETASRDEIVEPAFASQGIPLRIDGKVHEMDIVHVKCANQPTEGTFRTAKPEVDKRHRIRRNITVMRDRLQSEEDIERLR